MKPFMEIIWSKEVFAKNLDRYMKIKNISQKELAEIVGVSPASVNEWIKAKKYPRIDKIEIMAKYFGILKSDLIEERTKNFEARAEMQKKNDAMTDIVKRLQKDNDFFSLVEHLSNLDEDKIHSVKQMLNAFLK